LTVCRDPGNPERLTMKIGKKQEPPTWEKGQERSQLKKLGEGLGVQVLGYLLDARGWA
jgi:hypothetical protein